MPLKHSGPRGRKAGPCSPRQFPCRLIRADRTAHVVTARSCRPLHSVVASSPQGSLMQGCDRRAGTPRHLTAPAGNPVGSGLGGASRFAGSRSHEACARPRSAATARARRCHRTVAPGRQDPDHSRANDSNEPDMSAIYPGQRGIPAVRPADEEPPLQLLPQEARVLLGGAVKWSRPLHHGRMARRHELTASAWEFVRPSPARPGRRRTAGVGGGPPGSAGGVR